MIYAGILAGGIGRRMGNVDMPKQFITLGSKPLIIHTVEKFLLNMQIDYIYIGVVKEWVSHTNDLISRHIGQEPRIRVIEGGADRNGTIMNIINDIDKKNEITDADIIVTHDSVRPFITQRIISDNIVAALEYGACDTVIPATDTIVYSEDHEVISQVPDRAKLYQGQTPQSFNINLLRDNFNSLSEEDKVILTDAAKICILKDIPVRIVLGESFNIKITSTFDLMVANAMIKENKLND